MNEIGYRKCPICATTDCFFIYKHFIHLHQKNFFSEYHDIVYCNKCGLIFVGNIPHQNAIDEYYKNQSIYSDLHFPNRKTLLEKCTFLIEAVPQKNKKIIDIGCGNGELLKELKNIGYSSLFGLDLSNKRFKTAKEQDGIQIIKGTPETLIQGKMVFDVVVMSHVLEHIADLHTFMQQIIRISHDEVSVMIEVPDADRFPECVKFEPTFFSFFPEHLIFFTKDTLSALMSLYGFKMVLCEEVQIFSESADCTIPTTIPSIFVIRTIFKKNNYSLDNINEYIRLSEEKELQISNKIKEICDSGAPIIIWPLGNECKKLMESTALSKCNIVCFIDADSTLQGKSYNEIPIRGVDALNEYSCDILITTYYHSFEIIHKIREELCCDNNIIKLFGE